MRYRAPFQLFKKKISSGSKIYYYTTYDKLNSRKQYSTGCKTKSEALKYCLNLFKEDKLLHEKSLLFENYTKDWFIYDKCPYIKSVLERGKHFTKSSAINRRSRLVNKIIPYFKNIKIEDITVLHIETWLSSLKKKGFSNTTINIYLGDLKLIMKEAHRMGLIKNNPGLLVKSLANDAKEKSTLTEQEVKLLFDKNTIESIWSNKYIYYMNLIASQTGMRMAEIQALKEENIKEDHIYVKYSWERNFGLKCPKNGKSRIVPISQDLYLDIKNFIKKESTGKEFIFSKEIGGAPLTHTFIHYNSKNAFEKIVITKNVKDTRNITFHSWRHFYNTQLIKKGVPLPIIQAVIGHSSNSMTDKYTKLTKDDLTVVLD